MAELTVVGFEKDMDRASLVLHALKAMNNSWLVDLHDAVAVHRDYRGRLRVDPRYQATTGTRARRGGLRRGFIGALEATVGAVDADSWKDDYRISEDFVRGVSRIVRPGDSAIALLRTIDPDLVAAQFKGCGGTILRTAASGDQP